jgi:ribosomal RNA-processing protein 7
MAPSAPLIKAYLPVRLQLPDASGEIEHETFFFVREHQAGKLTAQEKKASATLFVANAPVVPGITTKILLTSLFGRYADIARVTVVDNPRQAAMVSTIVTPSSWSTAEHPTFIEPIYSEGKFAHVVFNNPKDMRKAMRGLNDIMKDSTLGSLTLEKIEIQTLSDETKRQHVQAQRKAMGIDEGEDFDEEEEDVVESEEQRGILKVAELYRKSVSALSRSRLLAECNQVMQDYEDAEEESRRAREVAKSQPDVDGFIAVNYTEAVGDRAELEQVTTGALRRKGNKRSRNKKTGTGAEELDDFYRFQRKENRKRTLEDLRKQFEDDLHKVKRLKEERQYRPF